MTSKKILLITGTDTGVGKTFVAAGLIKALADRGNNVIAIKPVETGVGAEVLASEDGVLLAQATGQSAPKHALTRLREAVAPPVAADSEGVELDLEYWIRTIENVAQETDVVLIEGAGGFLSPLTWKASARILASRVHARALLVIGNRIGCVNQTLLTVEALEQGRIPLVGMVLNDIGVEDLSVGSNLETIRRFVGIEHIVSMPKVSDWKEGSQHLEAVVDWILQ